MRGGPGLGNIAPAQPLEAEVYQALVLGVRDYVTKNGFPGVLLGLSGGIDSALTLAVAADALGPARVKAVMMPSQYTASMSREDACAEAEALSDKDLADTCLKRYQLAPVARVRALKS